jgi:hypothetical protein
LILIPWTRFNTVVRKTVISILVIAPTIFPVYLVQIV